MSSSEINMGLTTSHEDWMTIRECFVSSFRRYPLYKYIVPDESKRDAFLRAYLQANYEVTVGSGQGVLLGMWVDEKPHDQELSNTNENSSKKFIGGVLVVPPSSDGCGWATGSDEPYMEAYEKHGLREISKEGYARIKRYETWEKNMVYQKASIARIPMWNGIFCAMLPEYTSRGYGTTVYTETLKVMILHWMKQRDTMGIESLSLASNLKSFARTVSKKQISKDFLLTQLHSSKLVSSEETKLKKSANSSNNSTSNVEDIDSSSNFCSTDNKKKTDQTNAINPLLSDRPMKTTANMSRPLLVAISHSERSVGFHLKNGFKTILKSLYHDEVENISPFYMHVLVIDPLHSGSIEKFQAALQVSEIASYASFN